MHFVGVDSATSRNLTRPCFYTLRPCLFAHPFCLAYRRVEKQDRGDMAVEYEEYKVSCVLLPHVNSNYHPGTIMTIWWCTD